MNRPTVRFVRRARADMERSIDRFSQFPHAFSIAPESVDIGVELRQVFFKTRKGRTYRLVIRLEGSDAWILRVLRPGHSPLRAEDVVE